jgi:DNA-binding CsgD family transcriptional regulator
MTTDSRPGGRATSLTGRRTVAFRTYPGNAYRLGAGDRSPRPRPARAFAERARRELLATGETARKRTVETSSQLTAQEAQIARLPRDGLSNPQISVRLFISPRTVRYHLTKVFAKLGISSRSQLDRFLPGDPDTAAPR